MSYQILRSTAFPALLLLPMWAGTASAVEPETPADQACFFDLRAGFTRSHAPEIEEETNASGGGPTKYEWEGTNTHGMEFTLGAMTGRLCDYGGMVIGGQVAYAQYDISPSFFRRNDGITFSPAGYQLRNRTAGIDLMAGYGWSSSLNPDDLAVYLEFTPFVGGGASWADTEGLNTAAARVKESGMGWYYEHGLRGGLYLTERHFIVGVTGHYAWGSGEVDIDLPGGGKSTLTLDRAGFGGGVEAGWRF
ncbi:MAG: hypothetical protein H0V44_03205 [Planctomycetes bacterium]|nr:hypothetical protein [Planctomycetota bacterium]